jgi:hypothetical protein
MSKSCRKGIGIPEMVEVEAVERAGEVDMVGVEAVEEWHRHSLACGRSKFEGEGNTCLAD